MPTSSASARRDGDALVFTGALLRDDVAALWRQLPKTLDGVRRLDVGAVERIDSAGLALLAELAARAGNAVSVNGAPTGLAELRAAYRLDPSLGFAA
ncbi:STAS domain-containing protein [Luteimonas lutimaris]|uniref:STAS domain-containing protein n=1 Tax=Luteimonas lutimaris TaxID=698645 RepID=A0ABP7M2G1_9GAMM|nr:STAS domain-containing protein [Luteimonas sp.]